MMAADVSSSVTLQLVPVRGSKWYETDVIDNTVSQNFRVIRVTLLTRLACIMVGERSPLYVRLCVYVTMAAESTTTTAEPTTTETTTGAPTTTTPTPSGTVIFITAPW